MAYEQVLREGRVDDSWSAREPGRPDTAYRRRSPGRNHPIVGVFVVLTPCFERPN